MTIPEAALRALAEHGLRCDMNPTHDMSSLYKSEAFWQGYLRMLDTNIRNFAASALRQIEAAPRGVTGNPWDWPEDFASENGNYSNTCLRCDQAFIGNKHRRLCKRCGSIPRTNSPAPVEAARCPNCDDTGDVHRADGEWLGRCNCATGKVDAAPSPPDSSQGEHPEDFCELCGGPNIKPWFAPSPIWNKVANDHSVLCPQCFVALARRVGIDPVWRLAPDDYTGPDDDPERMAGRENANKAEPSGLGSVDSADLPNILSPATPPPSSPQVAVAEFEDGAKCPLCGWRNTPPAPQSAVALNWRCDGFDHHGRVVAVEKIERRRFHVYALKDDRWQADFYADHELPEYIEVGKYPDARSAMRACDDFLHEGDTVDYSGGGDFDPTKLRHGEDEEAAPQSAPIEYPKHKAECPRCGLSITVYGFPAEEAAPKPDEPLFTASMYGTAAEATKAREEWLAAKGEPQDFQEAWYEVASLLGISAQNASPKDVHEKQVMPRLRTLLGMMNGETVAFIRWGEFEPRLEWNQKFDIWADSLLDARGLRQDFTLAIVGALPCTVSTTLAQAEQAAKGEG
jgi:hypothetical protein